VILTGNESCFRQLNKQATSQLEVKDDQLYDIEVLGEDEQPG